MNDVIKVLAIVGILYAVAIDTVKDVRGNAECLVSRLQDSQGNRSHILDNNGDIKTPSALYASFNDRPVSDFLSESREVFTEKIKDNVEVLRLVKELKDSDEEIELDVFGKILDR